MTNSAPQKDNHEQTFQETQTFSFQYESWQSTFALFVLFLPISKSPFEAVLPGQPDKVMLPFPAYQPTQPECMWVVVNKVWDLI